MPAVPTVKLLKTRCTKSPGYKFEEEDADVYSDAEEPYQFFIREDFPQVTKRHRQPAARQQAAPQSGEKDILKKLAGHSSKMEGLLKEQRLTLQGAGVVVSVPSTSGATSKITGSKPVNPIPELPSNTKQCPVCAKSFQSKAKLRDHYAVHTKESQWECKVCEIPFTTKAGYDNHQRLHTEYKCPNTLHRCDVYFDSVEILRAHLNTDPAYEGYPDKQKCDLCCKRFTSRDGMLKHRKHRCFHNPNIIIQYFYCQYCNSRYRERKYVTQHEKYFCPHGPKEVRPKDREDEEMEDDD